MKNIPEKERLIDSAINNLQEVPDYMRREYTVALLTCVALETGVSLCDSLRLLHSAMAEIDKLFGSECSESTRCYEGLMN